MCSPLSLEDSSVASRQPNVVQPSLFDLGLHSFRFRARPRHESIHLRSWYENRLEPVGAFSSSSFFTKASFRSSGWSYNQSWQFLGPQGS